MHLLIVDDKGLLLAVPVSISVENEPRSASILTASLDSSRPKMNPNWKSVTWVSRKKCSVGLKVCLSDCWRRATRWYALKNENGKMVVLDICHVFTFRVPYSQNWWKTRRPPKVASAKVTQKCKEVTLEASMVARAEPPRWPYKNQRREGVQRQKLGMMIYHAPVRLKRGLQFWGVL